MDPIFNESIKTGATNDDVADSAPIPTHTGVTAFTRSALASNPSDSAAHCRELAATSLPSATATLPVYSAPIPMAAEKAADAGANTSAIFDPSVKNNGPDDAAATDNDRRVSSSGVNCGFDAAILSNSCTFNR
jgi:hypothetical protein